MIIGTLLNGKKCVYDLPVMIKTAEQLESLIYGYNENPSHREELLKKKLTKVRGCFIMKVKKNLRKLFRCYK
nr:hypothetical protein [uncultured Blautia sp.]